MKLKCKKTFTLIELLVTISIITILASVGIFSYVTYLNKADQREIDKTVEQINDYLDGEKLTYDGNAKTYSYVNYVLNKYHFYNDDALSLEALDENHFFIYNCETNKLMYVDISEVSISDTYDVNDEYKLNYILEKDDEDNIISTQKSYYIRSKLNDVAIIKIDNLRRAVFANALIVRANSNLAESQQTYSSDDFNANYKFYKFNNETLEEELISNYESYKDSTTIVYAYTSLASITTQTGSDSDSKPIYSYKGMFEGWSNITSVFCYSDVSFLGQECFKGCSSLTTIDFEPMGNTSSLTKIYANCFDGCISLTNVKLPSTLNEIQEYAFANTTNLGSITYLNSISSVAGYTFFNSGITSFGATSITSINANAFDNCDKLVSVSIPNSVSEIGNNAFYNTTKLTSFTIPTSLTYIASSCFENSGLTSLDIPSNIVSIRANAFKNCSSLACLSIPSSVTLIESYAFYGTNKLTSMTFNANISELNAYVFASSGLESIDLSGSSVTSLSDHCFSECKSLTNINFGNVNLISNGVFEKCSSLVEVSLQNQVTSIGVSAFQDCTNLTSVNDDSTLSKIYDHAFYNCSKLKDFNIPSSLSEIQEYAFYYSGLETLSLGNTLITISNYCFAGTKIESLTIPSQITTINDGAFSSCTKLESITFNEGLNTINSSAFKDDTSLALLEVYGDSDKSISKFPKSLITLGSLSFANTAISNISIGYKNITDVNQITTSYLSSIGNNAFEGCNKLISVKMNESVSVIGSGAFKDCSSLNSLSFTDHVIGSTSFAGVGLDAFSGTDKLPYIDFYDHNNISQYGTLTSLKEAMSSLTQSNIAKIVKCKKDTTTVSYFKYESNVWVETTIS